METTKKPVKIILADDHEILREGISRIIEKQVHMTVVAEASNGVQLVNLTNQFKPDVILTDIKMPLMDGIQATTIISKVHPGIGIIALSMFDDDQLIVGMMNAGARGYLLKNAGKEEIIEAIEAVRHHGVYFCADITHKTVRFFSEKKSGKRKDEMIRFSVIEKRIIHLICRQMTSVEISRQVQLSPRTVEGYRDSILRKIGARNVIGIVVYAIVTNLFVPEATKDEPGYDLDE